MDYLAVFSIQVQSISFVIPSNLVLFCSSQFSPSLRSLQQLLDLSLSDFLEHLVIIFNHTNRIHLLEVSYEPEPLGAIRLSHLSDVV